MTVDYTVISIGALSHNRLWGEGATLRTSHATTTLVTDGKRLLLVDPSLPAVALAARFNERTGKSLSEVTDVFCTTLRPVHRRSIAALSQANWYTSEAELMSYREYLRTLSESVDRLDRLDSDDRKAVEEDARLLEKFKPAPDKFSPQIHLYPLHGPTLGSAGLLLTPATQTILIAGDAALTSGHVLAGQVWEGCYDTELALESLQDLLEMADVIVPGHDNVMLTPKRMF